MNDMIFYLKDFREEIPTWLENYLRGERIMFKDRWRGIRSRERPSADSWGELYDMYDAEMELEHSSCCICKIPKAFK